MKLLQANNYESLKKLPPGVLGRYCLFLGYQEEDIKNVRPFFDVYETEGNRITSQARKGNELASILTDVSYRSFPKAIEYRPFRHKNLIDTVRKLSQSNIKLPNFSLTASGDNFCFVKSEQSERGSDMVRVSHDRYLYFKKTVEFIKESINTYYDILKGCLLFEDIDALRTNCDTVLLIIQNLQMTPDMSGVVNENGKTPRDLGLTVQLRDEVAHQIDHDFQVLKSHCHLAGNAASEFFIANNLHHYAQELLLVAQLLEYSSLISQFDSGHYGSNPTIKDRPDGLVLNFSNFHHPLLLRQGLHPNEILDSHIETLSNSDFEPIKKDLVEAQFLLPHIHQDQLNNKRTETFVWAEGIDIDDIQIIINKFIDANSKLARDVVSLFESSVSRSFGSFDLGYPDQGSSDEITIVVLPSPNMAGKSTSMKAIGLLLHEGLMGRHLSANNAEMSIPDQIFHNFNVVDNVKEQRSTFKAQLENINDFLTNATIDSIGLFDELFNGTSSDYQLALAWAFLEECSYKKLRTIVSTHNKDLALFSDPNGFETIKGHFKSDSKLQSPIGARNAKILSIGHDRKFKYGSERDSEALLIADEVLGEKHQNVIDRATVILDHIRS